VCATLEARARTLGRALSQNDVEAVTWKRAVDGRSFTAADYAASVATAHRTGRAVARFFADHDLLLTPTMCQLPYRLGVLDMMNTDGAAYMAALQASTGFTTLFNFTGNPAITLPLGWSRSGLPIGVQFAAPFGDEATLLRIAAQLESAQPWSHRHAPVQTGGAGRG
jgi:amidase/6-aminohexanoate-cyclic-dimer hydrolase